jgi:SET domain-containing protein
MNAKAIPSHWPPDVSYLTVPSYAPSMPSSLVSEVRGSRPSLPTPPCSHVSIRRITSKDHPAVGQYGLFATRNIAANSHICDYLGEVHAEDRISDYDLSLLRSQGGINVGVDASRMGNEGRFVNDYRGVKAKPNAIFKEGRTPSGELRVSIWSASSKIRKGDEILVSYGKAWWRARIDAESGADHGPRTEVR